VTTDAIIEEAESNKIRKSIRRINDLNKNDVSLPDFKLNMDKSSDDIIVQLREQLNQ
jgi:hypothetical protein